MRPDHDDQFTSERERHEANMASDAAFCAAMMRAIRRSKVSVKPGTFVDNTPLRPARFYGYAAAASCGSPAAMCAESGGAL